MNQITILIIDDEQTILELLAEAFARNNYSVKTANCAKDAKQLLMNECFDVVLSDFRMPGESGLAILELTNTFDKKPLFFFMSGHSDQTKEECIKRGATLFFDKPFDLRVVMNLIEDHHLKRDQSSIPFKKKLATVK